MRGITALVSLLASGAAASPIHVARAVTDLPRLIVYFQTTHDSSGKPISMLPLINEKGIALTHLIVCSFHVQENADVHLNDFVPSDPHFYTLWNETQVMRSAGVKVMGMVGGAAPGSFKTTTLDGDQPTFDKYYGQMRDIIRQYDLQGLDLDVEQAMSQAGIERLVDALRADFGSGFEITLAPVASALDKGGNLSGFDYDTLEKDKGSSIAFYNAQFYSGFGSMASPADYESIVANGFTPAKVVAGQLTSPDNGYGYIPYDELNSTVNSLRNRYGQIGGVMGWEYFNSDPGGTSQPWEWAQIMTQILRPNAVPELTITRELAEHLQSTYMLSSGRSVAKAHGVVDYLAMVNA